ncbi:hypothetical protein [Luteitalea sp.]|jgi:hypothetical protein|uniref:hypothetical protein n=1 Tax=Luteitalea sp. TaxID=2004800 RepID=UPI0037CC6686
MTSGTPAQEGEQLQAWRLVALAAAPAAASAIVLAVAQVGRGSWIQQALAASLATALGLVGARLSSRGGPMAASAVLGVSLAVLAGTLLTHADAPRRWLDLGAVRLYAAPLVLPALVLCCAFMRRTGGSRGGFADAALLAAGGGLALQPDASQLLALSVAAAVTLWSERGTQGRSTLTVSCLALLTAWTFTRPDPLQPVPHVEGVFALALAHSAAAGAAVVSASAMFVAGLWARVDRSIAAYYAALFACSVAGLTPAPLIGYGAGPWLGYGLFVALAPGCDDATRSSRRRSAAA